MLSLGLLTRTRRVFAPPLATPGQTPIWRATTSQTHSTINSGAPANFTTVSGEAFQRRHGSRYGVTAADASYQAGGWHVGVPYRQYVSGLPTTVFDGYYDFTANNDLRTLCSFGAWFKFSGIGGLTAPSRCISLYNSTGSPLTSISVGLVATGDHMLRLRMNDYTGNIGSPVDTVSLHEWVWLGLVSNCPDPTGLSGTKTYRAYYMRLGETTPTLIASTTTAANADDFVPKLARIRAMSSEITAVDPWFGGFSGASLYAVDTLANAALYPTNIVPPLNTHTWAVSGTAVGGGDGSSSAPFTGDELYAELERETFLGCQIGMNIAGTSVANPTTRAQSNTLKANYDNGTAVFCGPTIIGSGTIEQTDQWNFENVPGVRIGGTFELTTRRTLTGTYTRPDAGTYPNVWGKTGAGFAIAQDGVTGLVGGVISVDGVQYVPVHAANIAAASALLSAGKCFVDDTGTYFYSATDPNSNGSLITYAVPLPVAGNVNGTTTAQISLSTGVIDSTVTIKGGLMYACTGGSPGTVAMYNVGVANGDHTRAVVECDVYGGSMHNVCFTGSGDLGWLYLTDDCGFYECSILGSIPYTVYTSGNASGGSIFSQLYFTEHSYQLPGEAISTAVGTHETLYSHDNGAGVACFGTENNATILGVDNINASLEIA